MRCRFELRVTLLITVIIINLFNFEAAYSAQTPPRTKCYISVHDVHLSTSIYEAHLKPAIKANASSHCDKTQTQVHLTVVILKYGYLHTHTVATNTVISKRSLLPGENFENKDTFQFCKSKLLTAYYAEARATAVIGNKTEKTLVVRSEHDTLIPCGT
jgi:hypothetical protein